MYTSTPGVCEHCGFGHLGTCPRIKAIEYHPDGTVKRIEFHPAVLQLESVANPGLIRVPDAPSSVSGTGHISPIRT
jgi:hypothetical protein